MNVFVTGATGFVGGEIVRQLRATGHSVHILVRRRNSARVKDALGRGVTVHEGDILEPDSLPGALNQMQAVIHLVGIISEVGASTFENVHTRGTRNMVAAAERAGVKRFIQMSALGTMPNAVSRYHQSKWAAEETVRRSGLDFTIFRPSLIYGPQDHFVNLFAKMIRYSPILPVIGNGQTRFQPVFVELVASAFVRCLDQPGTHGQAYDLCGLETFSFLEILDQILSVMGKKRLKVRIPLTLARFQAAMLEFIFPRLLRQAPPLNRDQLTMLQEDNLGNGQPANALFELKPIKFRDGIASYLRA